MNLPGFKTLYTILIVTFCLACNSIYASEQVESLLPAPLKGWKMKPAIVKKTSDELLGMDITRYQIRATYFSNSQSLDITIDTWDCVSSTMLDSMYKDLENKNSAEFELLKINGYATVAKKNNAGQYEYFAVNVANCKHVMVFTSDANKETAIAYIKSMKLGKIKKFYE